MTTTSSSTSAPPPPPAPSASNVIGSAAQSLFNSLQTGSGVDTSSLVTSLVAAQFATKTDLLTQQGNTLTAQISSVTNLKSTLATFASALKNLSTGGTLTTQPVSSSTSIVSATALPGASIAGQTSSITVNQLASSQIAITKTAVADHTAVIGSGQLTLQLGTATYSADGTGMTGFAPGTSQAVTIDLTNASLDGIAAAINAKKAGVTASVVTDADGSAYLSIKGTTGAAQAFTLTATNDPDGTLSQFNVGKDATGTKMASVAQNAKLTVDGVSVERASNTIKDLVNGVQLQLNSVSPAPVSLTTAMPTDGLRQAITDFVDSYNEVVAAFQTALDPKTGPLKGDTAAQGVLRSLRTLTTKTLLSNASPNTPTTLGEIGIKTNNDGTLVVKDSAVTNALNTWPASVESMFAFSTSSSDGVTAAMQSISLNAGSTLFGLGASLNTYMQKQTALGKAQDDLSTQSATMTDRLTQQFASMNARVASYKSTQSFLTAQIAAWNKSD